MKRPHTLIPDYLTYQIDLFSKTSSR